MLEITSSIWFLIFQLLPLTPTKIFLSICALILFSKAVTSWSRQDIQRNLDEQHNEVLRTFHLYIQLCQTAYDNAYISSNRSLYHPLIFKETASEGKLWLWKYENCKTKNVKWLFVIRGSKTFEDFKEDLRIVQDHLYPHRQSRWQQDVQKIINETQRLLEKHQVPKDAELVFSGHSLGAAYAECLLHFFSAFQPSRAARAITFDSPGQPSNYRRATKMGPILPGLISLNAPVNMVNTLNRSCAERLYCCGSGSRISLNLSLEAVGYLWLLSYPMIHFFYARKIYQHIMRHRLTQISDDLRQGLITPASPERWPNYSNWFLSTFLVRTPYHRATVRSAARLPDGNEPTSLQPRLNSLPDTVDGMMLNVPYRLDGLKPNVIPSRLRSAEEGWEDFISMLDPNDKLIALVGETSQGKSSVFQALLGLPFHINYGLVAPGANTTLHPIVAFTGKVTITDTNGNQKIRRIFLIDMPGLGATTQQTDMPGLGARTQQTDISRFHHNSPQDLLYEINSYIGKVFYVFKEVALQDVNRNRWLSFKDGAKERKITVQVLHNTDNFQLSVQAEQKRILAEALALNESEILQCMAHSNPGDDNAVRERRGFNIADLKNHWDDYHRSENQVSDEGTLGERENYAEVSRAGGTTCGAISGTITAIGTWLPGIVWWEASTLGQITSIHGTLLIPYFQYPLIIAAGPVAVTAGVASAGYVTYTRGPRVWRSLKEKCREWIYTRTL